MIVVDASVVVDLLIKPPAEVTGATLVTRDARLARATGHPARIEVL